MSMTQEMLNMGKLQVLCTPALQFLQHTELPKNLSHNVVAYISAARFVPTSVQDGVDLIPEIKGFIKEPMPHISSKAL